MSTEKKIEHPVNCTLHRMGFGVVSPRIAKSPPLRPEPTTARGQRRLAKRLELNPSAPSHYGKPLIRPGSPRDRLNKALAEARAVVAAREKRKADEAAALAALAEPRHPTVIAAS